MLDTLLILFFPFFMIFAAASDLVSMQISNKISLALMAGFMVFAVWMEMDLVTIGWHWAMFGIVLLVSFTLFAFNIVGGGDAKLAASASLWFGWEYTADYVLLFGYLGGLMALVILQLRAVPLPERVAEVPWIARLHSAKSGVPYGIALGAAALLVYPQTDWMQHVFQTARMP
ncbi:MAG: prepilin peptidase [Rhizobiaceae bacterium]|nr:prepilin peptidase [Rhizobiaceae bacterium]